jgi:pyruvate,water dikinase
MLEGAESGAKGGRMIHWFEELGKEHNNMVGKKCANLGQMTRMGLAVPPGFAISIAMYEKFIHETGAAEEMASYVKGLGNLQEAGISVFDEMSRTLRSLIEAKEMPSSIREAINSYYTKLCNKTGIENVPVSVRSAGTESRPGMFETYLNVRGIEEVIDKVKKVWASAYTARAVAFRINKGLPVLGDELGIAIPKMVDARASGITFTVEPVTADDSKIILEANWGLGEGVVSGAESVDGFVVDKESLAIVARHVGNKVKCVVYAKNGADWAEVPDHMQRMPCISDEEILEIARVARSAEKTLEGPQDMEWAIDQDLVFPNSLFWLQTRPAKVAAKKKFSASSHIAELIAKKLGGL